MNKPVKLKNKTVSLIQASEADGNYTAIKGTAEFVISFDVYSYKEENLCAGSVTVKCRGDGRAFVSYDIKEEYMNGKSVTSIFELLTGKLLSSEDIYAVSVDIPHDDSLMEETVYSLGFRYEEPSAEGRIFRLDRHAVPYSVIYPLLGMSAGMSIGMSFGKSVFGMLIGLAAGLITGIMMDRSGRERKDRVLGNKEK